jgi:hypothetical protein
MKILLDYESGFDRVSRVFVEILFESDPSIWPLWLLPVKKASLVWLDFLLW